MVALGQACEGGRKRWFTSTLELQRVSLDFCLACRSAPTLHVYVQAQTPRSLWSSRAPTNTNSSKARLSTRVPIVRALRLTWVLPMKVLVESAAVELWAWSELVHLLGALSAGSLGSVVWPKRLQHLVLDTSWPAVAMKSVQWPPNLQHLKFGVDFNQPIVGAVWPDSLQQLSFGHCFNRPIFGAIWPASLQKLSFGNWFNQSIVGVAWPASLQQLSFGAHFTRPIAGAAWPVSLQSLSFEKFRRPLVGVVWPASLRQLSFGCDFNQCIVNVVWPASLQQLSFGNGFNSTIVGVVWPASLQQLSFGDRFYQSIVGVVWPDSLQQLSFGESFNRSIVGVVWPASLQQLSFGRHFNQPIVGVVWPASLQRLSFGRSFNHSIVGVVWPASLQQLSFGYRFNQPITEVAWPASLRSVTCAGRRLLWQLLDRTLEGRPPGESTTTLDGARVRDLSCTTCDHGNLDATAKVPTDGRVLLFEKGPHRVEIHVPAVFAARSRIHGCVGYQDMPVELCFLGWCEALPLKQSHFLFILPMPRSDGWKPGSEPQRSCGTGKAFFAQHSHTQWLFVVEFVGSIPSFNGVQSLSPPQPAGCCMWSDLKLGFVLSGRFFEPLALWPPALHKQTNSFLSRCPFPRQLSFGNLKPAFHRLCLAILPAAAVGCRSGLCSARAHLRRCVTDLRTSLQQLSFGHCFNQPAFGVG